MLRNGCSSAKVACNSHDSISEFETKPLESCGSEVLSVYVDGELHAKVWDASAADWLLWLPVVWWLFDPVVGNALRAVGYRDRAALAESEGRKRAPHRYIVLVGVAAQVIRVLDREREDRPSDAVTAYRGHAVNDVVVGIGMPCAFDLGVGFVWTGCERKDGERPSLIGHEEAVSARDVFFSINATRVSVGPLSRVPIRLHECPSMLIRALDEREVVRRCDSNLHFLIL